MDRLPAEIVDALNRAAGSSHDAAHAMPGAFYVSARMLEAERAHLFGREWICVGRADEIPEAGDYMTYDSLGRASR